MARVIGDRPISLIGLDARLPADLDGVIDELWELEKTFEWMTEQTRRVPSFAVQPRLVLANFAYAKLPMVRDLETAFDKLRARHASTSSP